MSADFWAGYVSGAAGIVIGNPLDLIKVRLQAGRHESQATSYRFQGAGELVRGSAAPVLGYGALNALLFVSYNRTLLALGEAPSNPIGRLNVWAAGAVGGLATWVISAPTEVIKCRAQIEEGQRSSWGIAKDIWRTGRLRQLYLGGSVTSLRDSVGYGFYFWSYEICKQWMSASDDTSLESALKVLLCGGVAGMVTWTSVFPLDVVKTRVQTQASFARRSVPITQSTTPLLPEAVAAQTESQRNLNAFEVARQMWRAEGTGAFFRGLGVCNLRAFVVNAVQWTVYEGIVRQLGGL